MEYLKRNEKQQPIFWSGAEAFTDAQKKHIFSKKYLDKFKDINSWEVIAPYYQKFKEKFGERQRLNWMSYVDLNLRLPDLLLMRVDKMTMGVSLEGRVPFLDHKFVELIFNMPVSKKFRYFKLKYLLKKSVTGIIPKFVIKRKKQGFGVPVYDWCSSLLGNEMLLKVKEFNDEVEVFDDSALDELFKEKRYSQMWYLYNLAVWWEVFIKSKNIHIIDFTPKNRKYGR